MLKKLIHNSILPLVLSLLLSNSLFAQTTIEVLQTQQPASEIAAMLQPLYPTEASFSASGYKLIIKASPATMAEIKALLNDIDTPAKNLLIEVAEAKEINREQRRIGASGRVERGDVTIEVGDSGVSDSGVSNREIGDNDPSLDRKYGDRRSNQQQGGTITYDDGDTQARVNSYHTRRRNAGQSSQQLRVLEGNWAVIQTGQYYPYRNYRHPEFYDYQEGNYRRGYSSVEYLDVTSGFEVKPRLTAEGVSLTVRPFSNRRDQDHPRAIAHHSLNTTISGKLGEWIPLGGVLNTTRSQGNSFSASTNSRDESDLNLYIRVTTLD